MRRYRQLTSEERYALSALKRQGLNQSEIARTLGRHRSTISRELQRNTRDGWYRPFEADEQAHGRRYRSRRNWQFSEADWKLVRQQLEELWSPEQIAGRLDALGLLRISHETIYRYVWEDWSRGGALYRYLRCAQKQRRKRYRSYDRRGRLTGKRHISERPASAEQRSRVGHLEGDTMIGGADKHCVLTLVDRKTGFVLIGKMRERTVQAANERAVALIKNAGRPVKTLTLDNGTEFSRLQEHRGEHRYHDLLRYPAPLLGTGHE